MKNLQLEELIILSMSDRTARKIVFDPRTTIITGDNDVGKSCLVKSIYHSLGGSISQFHPGWKKLNTITVVTFRKDALRYKIFRYEKLIVIFNEQGEVVQRFSSLGNGLAPFYKTFFDFPLELPHKQSEELKTPLPSHYFLPFYIDQDAGWTKNWNSFDRLIEFKEWRKDIIEYHTGLKPNRYYMLKATMGKLRDRLQADRLELATLDNIVERTIKKKNSISTFSGDIQLFQKEIDALIQKISEIAKIEQKYKDSLWELGNEISLVDTQISLVSSTKHELTNDYDYFATSDHTISCPLCGQQYENSFKERFEIASDESRCLQLLAELQIQKNEILGRVANAKSEMEKCNAIRTDYETILSSKKGDLILSDYIENEGYTNVVRDMVGDRDKVLLGIGLIEEEVKGLSKQMKDYIDGEIIKEINEAYLSFMDSYLLALNVTKLEREDYVKITSQVMENGSDLPRALLAYFYSILHVMVQYSSTYMCPIVIDSPLQDEQDEQNSKTILEFIRDKKPDNMQLILSCVDLHGVKFDGVEIHLDTKYKMLSSEMFDEIYSESQAIIEAAIASESPPVDDLGNGVTPTI